MNRYVDLIARLISEDVDADSSPKIIPYYKVTTRIDTSRPPGFMTSDHSFISGYLSAFLGTYLEDKEPVYVIRADIDVHKLKPVERLLIGTEEGEDDIKPGIYGTKTDAEEGINHPLDIIMYNEPINYKVVGAYLRCKNIEPHLSYKTGFYKEGGRAWRDGRAGEYSTDDVSEGCTEEEYKEYLDKIKRKNRQDGEE